MYSRSLTKQVVHVRVGECFLKPKICVCLGRCRRTKLPVQDVWTLGLGEAGFGPETLPGRRKQNPQWQLWCDGNVCDVNLWFSKCCCGKGIFSLLLYFPVLDELLDDQRKQGRIKSATCRMKPLKQPDPLSHSEEKRSSELLSPVRPRLGIQPLFAAAPSQSVTQLPIDPQRHVKVRGAGENRKEVSGTRRELGQRTVKSDEGFHLRSEETDETCSVRDIEKIFMGRKVSKKHKSK